MSARFPSPAGWYSDPLDVSGARYWDGYQWTAHTSIAQPHPQPQGDAQRIRRAPFTALPAQAAFAGVIITIASLVASKFLLRWLVHYDWPIIVYTGIAVVSAYAPLLLSCWWVLKRWGSGNMRDDVGLRFRPVDLGWGPLTWIAALVGQVIVAVVIVALKVPISSNTEGISKHQPDRVYILSFALVAMVVAPIVEELVFRGLIMRGLRSVLPAWLCVGVQGVLFGAAHIDPIRGVGNVGLVMVLSTVGIVLGGSAYLLRRLAPSMIAHALFNTLVFIVVVSR
jgi:hypothetical protein